MRAVAHGWSPKGMKVPPIAVAKEFMKADMKKRAERRAQRRTIAHGDK